MQTRRADALAAGTTWIVGSLIFFRQWFQSRFTFVSGSVGDTTLVVALHEHWLLVARGQVSWTSPIFYFPAKGALGYSDTFALNSVFYVPLRLVGFDQFAAYQWTLILLTGVGVVGSFILIRHITSLPRWLVAALSAAFVFGNNLYVTIGHPQHMGVCWLALAASLGVTSARSRVQLRSIGFAAASGLLFGLVLYSTYYTGWFGAAAGAIFSACFALLSICGPGWRDRLRSAIARGRRGAYIAAAVGFCTALIPFAITYLPVYRISGGRTYPQISALAPRPLDLFNIGDNNMLWHRAASRILDSGRLADSERAMALTPILLLLVAASMAVAATVRWRDTGQRRTSNICLAAGLTTGALLALPIHFGNLSLWRIPFRLAPGAPALRAVGRVWVIGGFTAMIAIAAGTELLWRRWTVERSQPPRRLLALAAGASALLLVEQINTTTVAVLNRPVEVAKMTTAPRPPVTCVEFYVVSSLTNPVPSFHSEIEAILLAQYFELPTINGYSGLAPPDFGALNPDDENYQALINDWVIRVHPIDHGLCLYERLEQRWTVIN